MSDAFFNTSKTIANDFLQSVVFIDDQAFGEKDEEVKSNSKDKNQEFDAVQITRAFANSQKVCAVYRPENTKDINNLALLAKKADVTVLDWSIEIHDENLEGENGEEDAEEIDPRGPHTRKIISEILSDPLTGKGSLKLILIYTGETDLPSITDAIYDDLLKQKIDGLQKGDCNVFTENIRILVLAKQGGKDQFKYNPELKSKIVPYADLPDFILTEFTEMTSGLLTNFVLQSLTAIRDNIFRLVKIYKKDLDPSFLSHHLLLPNPEDSEEHLVEVLSHSIQALLNYNRTGNAVSKKNILNWVESLQFNQSITIGNQQIEVNNSFIKDWLKSSFVEACQKRWIQLGLCNAQNTPDSKFRKAEKEFEKRASDFFVENNAENLDSKFSILTHHKSNLKQPGIAPRLTLGTLVKQLPKNGAKYRKDESVRYFLCIQAKCDSVRLKSLRKFLFLPLEGVSGNVPFHFVIEEGLELTRLRISKEAFEVRTIKFKPRNNHTAILAYKRNEHYYFKSNHDEKFLWLADLKDAHAQREVSKFAHQIARVGLDESEWLRRWAT